MLPHTIRYRFSQVKNRAEGKSARIRIVSSAADEVTRNETGETEILLSVPDANAMTRRKYILLLRRMIALAKSNRIRRCLLETHEFCFPSLTLSDEEYGEIISTQSEMANFQFVEFLTKPPEGFPFVGDIIFTGASSRFQKGCKRGATIGEEVNACRRLANLPGGEVTPETLAFEAKRIAAQRGMRVKILEEREMRKCGMGGIVGVGKGSAIPPKLILLEYRGAKDVRESPIVFVGKGVTFDTGGINLKPSDAILGMNMDMSGGAAVLHALSLSARLGVRKNLVALIPAVENMPSGSSYRPGDVLRSMSGKTIEVLNTDAEGRIILADALHYAKRYHPRLVVDVATLTGAALVALGERASAIFTRDAELEKGIRELGELSGDFVWPLPLWEEYDEEIRGTFGDVANIGRTKWGGAITAAAFLAQFAIGYRWVHIDMAPRMTAVEGEYLAKGAAGAPVRLLLKIAEAY